jgi:hypothetical protein
MGASLLVIHGRRLPYNERNRRSMRFIPDFRVSVISSRSSSSSFSSSCSQSWLVLVVVLFTASRPRTTTTRRPRARSGKFPRLNRPSRRPRLPESRIEERRIDEWRKQVPASSLVRFARTARNQTRTSGKRTTMTTRTRTRPRRIGT